MKVLVAIDGSKYGRWALEFLLEKFGVGVPRMNGPRTPVEVNVVHVMPFLKYPELKEAGRKLVERSAARLNKGGFLVDETCRLGKPAEEILKVAAEKQSDLIVTGAKGLGGVVRFLLGSVSTKLVQHSACSVLVVR